MRLDEERSTEGWERSEDSIPPTAITNNTSSTRRYAYRRVVVEKPSEDDDVVDEASFHTEQEAPSNVIVTLYGLKDQTEAIKYCKSNLLNFLVYSPGLWVRDARELKQMLADVGGEYFRRTKDLRAVAIFYLAAGKKEIFVTLAKTDQVDGPRIIKLLGGNLEGKKSQLSKNAYSLMSKREYIFAAAIFVAAGMLGTAADILMSRCGMAGLTASVVRAIEGGVGEVGRKVMGDLEGGMGKMLMGDAKEGRNEVVRACEKARVKVGEGKGGRREMAQIRFAGSAGGVVGCGKVWAGRERIEGARCLGGRGMAKEGIEVLKGIGEDVDPFDRLVNGSGKGAGAVFNTVASIDPMAAESSIFDDFGGPPAPPKPAPTPVVDPMAAGSSIFDDFGGPPAPPKPAPTPVVDPMAAGSSIFDDFGGPPPAPKASVPPSPQKSTPPPPPVVLTTPSPPYPTLPVLPTTQSSLDAPWYKDLLLHHLASTLIRRFVHSKIAPWLEGGAEHVHRVYMEGGLPEDCVPLELERVCGAHGLDSELVVRLATASKHPTNSLLCSLLLYSANENAEKVEEIIRDKAQDAVRAVQSTLFTKPTHGEDWLSLALQIELFIFQTRLQDPLPLSLSSVATISVRLFLLLSFYPSRDWYALDLLLTKKADCAGDEEEAERESARSSFVPTKITSEDEDFNSGREKDGVEQKLGKGGGWQFLQDVTREEAEIMLKEREHIGGWLIRPNKDDPNVFSLSFLSEGGPQHAVVRLEEEGFRCGSYGPFPKLWGVLEKISDLLSTRLDFDQDDLEMTESRNSMNKLWSQPSPNAGVFRGLGMRRIGSGNLEAPEVSPKTEQPSVTDSETPLNSFESLHSDNIHSAMLDYLILHRLVVQVFSINVAFDVPSNYYNDDIDDSDGCSTPTTWLNPLRRVLVDVETRVREELAFGGNAEHALKSRGVIATLGPASSGEEGYEVEVSRVSPKGEVVDNSWECGDALIEKMMSSKSGRQLEFKPYKVVDKGLRGTVVVVLFAEEDGVEWLVGEGKETWWRRGVEPTRKEAILHLRLLESRRVIERVGPKSKTYPVAVTLMSEKGEDVFSSWLGGGEGEEDIVRYRIVDPWEVSGFTSSKLVPGYLGRNHYDSLTSQTTYGRFGQAGLGNRVEEDIRLKYGVGGIRVWTCINGNSRLEKCIKLQGASGTGDDEGGYLEGVRRHIYKNTLFSLISSSTRFISVVQLSLLDYKNLGPSPPNGSLTVYSVIRLRRSRSKAPMNNRGRSKDSVLTEPVKIGSGGWGSSANFRFPLPEGVSGSTLKSFSSSRDKLFKGPPTVLCMNVYEKRRIIGDCLLGNLEIDLEGVGGNWENWEAVGKEGWFVRVRIGVRFEIMRISG